MVDLLKVYIEEQTRQFKEKVPNADNYQYKAFTGSDEQLEFIRALLRDFRSTITELRAYDKKLPKALAVLFVSYVLGSNLIIGASGSYIAWTGRERYNLSKLFQVQLSLLLDIFKWVYKYHEGMRHGLDIEILKTIRDFIRPSDMPEDYLKHMSQLRPSIAGRIAKQALAAPVSAFSYVRGWLSGKSEEPDATASAEEAQVEETEEMKTFREQVQVQSIGGRTFEQYTTFLLYGKWEQTPYDVWVLATNAQKHYRGPRLA